MPGVRLEVSIARKVKLPHVLAVFLLIIMIGSVAYAVFTSESSIIIPSAGSIQYRKTGVIFKDDFESGDFRAWTGSVRDAGDIGSVLQVNPYEGHYHAFFQTNGSTSALEWAVAYYNMSSETGEIYARGYFHLVDGLPLDDDGDRFGLLAIYNVGKEDRVLLAMVRIARISGVDMFELKMASGGSYATVVADAVYPQENVWYCIELYFRVHPTAGEGRVWIDGIERIAATDQDTDNYGNIQQVRYGLIPVGVQHPLSLYLDSAVISTEYMGRLYNFAVVCSVNGDQEYESARNNICWMLGNLSIRYKTLLPSEVTDETVFDDVDGLVSFVSTSEVLKNASAVKAFANAHVVITHGYDFANFYHSSFSQSYVLVTNVTGVTYLMNWGAFRTSDRPELRRVDYSLGVFLARSMVGYSNITKIAQYNDTHIAFFHMSGQETQSGYYVMDLYATGNSSLRANNWLLFPVIDYVRAISVGKYARWLAREITLERPSDAWYSLDWVNSFMQSLANNNPDLVQLRKFGTTVQGRNMSALFIGKGSQYIFVDAAIHGDEKTGTFAALRTAELLVEYYNANNSYWKSRLGDYKIVVVPVSNPDGFYANDRTNANGKDLNRDYPPEGNLTEPESRAFVNLLGNYTPTISINLHTYLNQMLFNEDRSNLLTEPYKTFSLETWRMANVTYTSLKHWGKKEEWFTGGWPELVGQINYIGTTGYDVEGALFEYAWWKYKTISAIAEFYHSSPAFNLLGQEYFCSIIFAAIQHYDRTLDIQAYSTGKISNANIEANTFTMHLYTEELQKDIEAKIYVGDRGKPAMVVIDGVLKTEGNGWSWNENSRIIDITRAESSVSISWAS
jgi:hypothetical protein